jgi:hypothetical protein
MPVQDPTATARDFYIAYRVLSESNDRVLATIVSDNPFSVSPRMMERLKSGELKQVYNAQIVCLAFALELYLKAVLVHSVGNVPRTHNLSCLFQKVPTDIRAKIIEELQTRMPEISEKVFDSNVQAIAEAFDEWRYVFENGQAAFMPAFGMNLAEALSKIIKELKVKSSGSA